MILDFDIPIEEIERRKQVIRHACIAAAGGIENVTSTEWDEKWCPE